MHCCIPSHPKNARKFSKNRPGWPEKIENAHLFWRMVGIIACYFTRSTVAKLTGKNGFHLLITYCSCEYRMAPLPGIQLKKIKIEIPLLLC
jgi:hypothetical protein